jgi:hypothetical protein
MNLNKKIGFLLDRGLNPQFISTLNEGKINLLFEKMSSKETKEAIQTVQQTGYKTKATAGDEIAIGNTVVKAQGPVEVISQEKPGTAPKTEGEMTEKFESKVQQGLFWARCNKCKDDDCKWCKMAKEFSKSTSKKQYEKMPEKKHPKKTVKYKKKETNEVVDYNKALTAAITGQMKSNMGSLLNPKLTSESKLRNHLENIIEKNLKPTMTKRDLIRLIERTMGDTKEKETETETEKKEKEKTGNPFKKPDRDPAEAGTETAPSETETEEKKKKKKKSPFERPNPNEDPAEAKNKNRRKGEQSEGLDYFMSQVKKHRLI